MKTRNLAVVLAGMGLCVVSSASALPLYQHASSFHAAKGADQQFINRSSLGVSNIATVNKVVVGAPLRNPHASGNQTVTIAGWNSNLSVTSRCTITSLSAYSPVQSTTLCTGAAPGCTVAPPDGHWYLSAQFAPFNGPYVVTCTLLAAGANTNRIQWVRVTP
jgi:hypothetical protein